VQAQPPEVARVAGAVAVLGPAGQLGAVHGLPGAGALDRGRIDDPHIIGPQAGVAGQHPDQPLDRRRQPTQPLVVAGLLGQIPKQVAQMGAGIPQPAGLAGEPQQRLQHREGDQLRVADPRCDPDRRPAGHPFGCGLQQIVGAHVQCRGEGVQISVHESLLPFVWVATLILGTLHLSSGQPRRRQTPWNWSSSVA
jgi:hypothetical protein